MEGQSLRELVEASNDKLEIFLNADTLNHYDITVNEFLDLIKNSLNDEEIKQLFEVKHIKNCSKYIKESLIKFISDDIIKIELIKNDDIVFDLEQWEIKELVKSLGETEKIKILRDLDFLKKHSMHDYEIVEILSDLSNNNKLLLLADVDCLTNQLQLKDYQIKDIIISIKDEKIQLDMIEKYNLNNYQINDIFKTFSDSSKKQILLENKYDFVDYEIVSLIASMNTDYLIEFINTNKEYIIQKEIAPYQIIKRINSDKQLSFVSKLKELDMSVRRKKANFSNIKTRNQK